MLIFDGDLVHAGAAYPHAANVRMHTYLYATGVRRPDNTTYKVEWLAKHVHEVIKKFR